MNKTAVNLCGRNGEGARRSPICCRACGDPLRTSTAANYWACGKCGSANLVIPSSAIEDNIRYFDILFDSGVNAVSRSRKLLFLAFERIYNFGCLKQSREFFHALQETHRLLRRPGVRVLEIGFGGGDELARLLLAGVDAYGIDISEVAVARFRQKYGEFADRVRCSDHFDADVDVVYSNALFEHLDDPTSFLLHARERLGHGGLLIIRLPVLWRGTTEKDSADINFWIPCHRVLYTTTGLNLLLAGRGFRVLRLSTLEYFGFRVMNAMLDAGCNSIMDLRNPYLEPAVLKCSSNYLVLLVRAISRKSLCSDCVVIAQPI